ncbi:putative P-type Ca(2+) transporter [Helianthus anomalus]
MVQHVKAIEFPTEKEEVIILWRIKLMDILLVWPRGNFVVMGWDSFLSFVFSAWVSTKLCCSRSLNEDSMLLGMNFEVARSKSAIIQAFPFSSEKKRGGVAVRRKGAVEIVLAACTRYMDSNEQLVPLDEGTVGYFKKAIEDMAHGSLQCVAIAYRPLTANTVPTYEEELTHWELSEVDLVLLAIVAST